ncbi:MAG: GDSL-type esterase/lipase family protein [Opitutales bacterium]
MIIFSIRKHWLKYLSAAILCASFVQVQAQPAAAASAASAAAAPATPTIFVCGDSTAKNNARGAEGWGTAIAAYFDPAKVTVSNVAHAGQSSRTYYNLDWPKVLPQIKSGDYMLLVFGINDGGPPRGPTDRGSVPGVGNATVEITTASGKVETVHTYGWYMSKMATDAEAKGARVYLLTVTTRDIWSNPNAKFRDATIQSQQPNYNPAEDKIERGTANGKYTQWTEEIGQELNLPVLDLTNLLADKYEAMGREKVMANYLDHNHTNPTGADIVAASIVSGLKAFPSSPFTPLLSAKGQAVPAAATKYVSVNAPGTVSSAGGTQPVTASGAGK